MIADLVNGVLLVATQDFAEKVNRTIRATPRQKIGAVLGGAHDYYLSGEFANEKWHRVACDALDALSKDD